MLCLWHLAPFLVLTRLWSLPQHRYQRNVDGAALTAVRPVPLTAVRPVLKNSENADLKSTAQHATRQKPKRNEPPGGMLRDARNNNSELRRQARNETTAGTRRPKQPERGGDEAASTV